MFQYQRLTKKLKVDNILLNVKVNIISFHLHKNGDGILKAGELVYDAIYRNPVSKFKQWYNIYEDKNNGTVTIELNTFIVINVQVKTFYEIKILSKKL